MKKIRVSSIADQDLDDIWYFLATQTGDADYATRTVDAITRAFPLFARAPNVGAKRDEIEEGVRSFPIDKYVIYYKKAGSQVVISRIIHGSRDQGNAYRGD